MLKLAKKIVKNKIAILIVSFLLLIPTGIIYANTRINYDILSYLPEDIDTMKGQEILTNEFGTGAFAICVVEGMDNKGVAALENEIKGVKHVNKAVWYDSLADLSVPMEVLPEDVRKAFVNDEKNSTLMFVTFATSSSADETLDAIAEIRKLTKKQCFLSGLSSVVLDI